jgi:hypothetical protein
VTVCEYATPTLPAGRLVVVIVSVAGAETTIWSGFVAVCVPSVTCTVKL